MSGLVLASRSPQRRAILEQLGVSFEVVPADVEETSAGGPRELVEENARRKADTVARARRTPAAGAGGVVLGVDTEVVLDGRPHGKPQDEGEARAVLRRLSERSHEVWSGLALVRTGGGTPGPQLAAAVTEVRFRRLDAADLAWYLASGEWRERAGGYAIQGRGAALVEGIVGDYWNVVGLPVSELMRLMPELVRG